MHIIYANMQRQNYTHNILIVEDNVEVANLIYSTLAKDSRYCIEIAHRINQAQKSINKKFFDLICLDIFLPDGNGIEFCKSLKENPDYKATKILIISNSRTLEYKTQAFENGSADYIYKPFHPKDIEIRVKHHLGIMEKPFPQINYKRFSLDTIRMLLVFQNYELPLTKTEFLILKYLFEHNGVAKTEVLSKFLSSKKFKNVENKSVIVSIKRLREKLKRNTGSPFIKTKYGVGYYVS